MYPSTTGKQSIAFYTGSKQLHQAYQSWIRNRTISRTYLRIERRVGPCSFDSSKSSNKDVGDASAEKPQAAKHASHPWVHLLHCTPYCNNNHYKCVVRAIISISTKILMSTTMIFCLFNLSIFAQFVNQNAVYISI